MAEIDDLRDELILARNLYDELKDSYDRDRADYETRIQKLEKELEDAKK